MTEADLNVRCEICGGTFVTCPVCHVVAPRIPFLLDSCWRRCANRHRWRCTTGVLLGDRPYGR